jgi:uracil-DNA glycosylase
MDILREPSWSAQLSDEFQKPYFQQLTDFVRQEYAQHTCFPKGKHIFAAFDRCPFDAVKVVILGQDPYHGTGQANGLCFSVNNGVPHPPSLINIFKELGTDLQKPYPKSGNLEAWADQGVLLLNATLTVRAHQAGSHQGEGWETFTDGAMARLSQEREGIIFLLWGGFAKKKARLIDGSKHHILTAGHPSPLSANRGHWFGNRHFSKCNEILQQRGNKTIAW